RDKDGNTIGCRCMINDITGQVNLEAQLQHAQKMEAIDTLASGIAHDFNNLLMGFQGNASLMLIDMGPRHPYYERLKNIEELVHSGAELTRQLLGFVRGGKYEVKPTDLNKLVRKSSRMFGRTKKEISIRRKYEKGIWTVEVDQGQIEQVLLNLYVNAWQAMPRGGEMHIQTENVTLDESYIKPYRAMTGRYVRISVTDNGVGMDEATKHRIFEPFFTTKVKGRGAGLGLASTYGIIKNHGGLINVYSEKGEGTTFNIYLPVSDNEIVEESKSPEKVFKGTETILLVDDEDVILEVNEKIMQSLGYKVLSANSGKGAVEIYKQNQDKIDIVVLDMIMPDIGGGEAYELLRKINPDAKVILSSGYSINGQASEILARGCRGFIQKPFNITDLSRKLRETLD
ncbi:MAG: response regulator, partial [Thermodesulfobacteriota bacterium]|nr:response regulator [Thermodesulfobacteriota bacterium]